MPPGTSLPKSKLEAPIPTFQKGDAVATHPEPAGKERADYVIRAFVGEMNGRPGWEQLSVRRLDAHTLELCCIPFFLYGFSFGDTVIHTAGELVLVIASKFDTFRVWLGDADRASSADVIKRIEEIASAVEWSSEHLLAVSVIRGESSQHLRSYLELCKNSGRIAEYELGVTR